MTSAIDDDKKKLLILNLTRFLNGSKKGLLRQALISFARNAELNRVNCRIISYFRVFGKLI
jgi:hypothetical protein